MAAAFVFRLPHGRLHSVFFWQTGVSDGMLFYWNVGFAFLCIINLLFVKGVTLYKYLQVKKLRTRSYVRLEKNEVVHYLLNSILSHRQVEAAKDTRFFANGKQEYISADTFYIRHVKNIRRKQDGSIVIDGIIERESLNDGWEEYSFEYGKAFIKTIARHTIPAYYDDMDEIFQALSSLCR